MTGLRWEVLMLQHHAYLEIDFEENIQSLSLISSMFYEVFFVCVFTG